MSLGAFLTGAGLDRYGVMARLRPALLTILPTVLVIGYWVPASVQTASGLSLSMLSACGLTYLFAMIARAQGLALERRLGERAGRRRSARLLTFADDYLTRDTKIRYHRYLTSHGCRLSDEEEERADPQRAFARARSAVDRLLALTKRPQVSPRLFLETVAYGFVRNLRGLKAIALMILAATLATDASLTVINRHDQAVLIAGLAIGTILAAAAGLWIFLVTDSLVCSASTSYAERFLENCEFDAAADFNAH